jgi:hypothetical protein
MGLFGIFSVIRDKYVLYNRIVWKFVFFGDVRLSSVEAQDLQDKTQLLKEWFDGLTIPSNVEGKKSTVRRPVDC